MSFSSPGGQGGWQNSPQGQRWDQRFDQFEQHNPRIAQMLGGMGYGGGPSAPSGTVAGMPLQPGGMGGDAGGPMGGPPRPLGPPLQQGGMGDAGPPGGGQLGNPQGPGFGQTGPGGPPPQQGFWANPNQGSGVGTNIGSQMPAPVSPGGGMTPRWGPIQGAGGRTYMA